MPSSPPPSPPPAIAPAVVARLREAGCVFAEDEARLLVAAAASPTELDAMVGRRVAGVPLEHVVGYAEFCGLRIAVSDGVFVPRRRTEVLARQAALAARAGAVVVDLCCGAGAVGVVVASTVEGVELHAVDVDPAATRCARGNLAPVGGRVYDGDLFAPLPDALRGRVDVLVANAPYVPTDVIRLLPPEARRHEPRIALDGGADGLDVLRRVVREAPDWLASTGTLLVESSAAQAAEVARLLREVGLISRVVTDDDAGSTVVIGKHPAVSERGCSSAGCAT